MLVFKTGEAWTALIVFVCMCVSVCPKTSLYSRCHRGQTPGWWEPSVSPWPYTFSFYMWTLFL